MSHPLVQQLEDVHYQLFQLMRRVQSIQAELDALQLTPPEAWICTECDFDLRGKLKLAEHIYLAHDGPLPQHYAEAEAHAEGGK